MRTAQAARDRSGRPGRRLSLNRRINLLLAGVAARWALGCGLSAVLLVATAACGFLATPEFQVQRFAADNYPALLSDWQIVRKDSAGRLQRASDTLVYELNTPLFADYTLKLRTISLPPGTSATYSPHDTLDFPVGTVISKTFYYDTRDVPLSELASNRAALFGAENTTSDASESLRLLETRLLVHDASGWQALPYVWNDDQSDARLSITGALKNIGDNIYVVPSKDECGSCHAVGREKILRPIGPKARHLHRHTAERSDPSSLQALVDKGWLTLSVELDEIETNAVWRNNTDPAGLDNATVEHHARSYLDANCGHCHNPKGSADTSQLFLDYANIETYGPRNWGLCKPPIAAGKGTGGNLYSITPGKPDKSILTYRMASTDPGAMMPEAGRTRVHAEGVALVEEWIRRQQGTCNKAEGGKEGSIAFGG